MSDYQMDKANLDLLLEQRKIISGMPATKQAKYLPKIDSWIDEVSELLDESVKEAV